MCYSLIECVQLHISSPTNISHAVIAYPAPESQDTFLKNIPPVPLPCIGKPLIYFLPTGPEKSKKGFLPKLDGLLGIPFKSKPLFDPFSNILREIFPNFKN